MSVIDTEAVERAALALAMERPGVGLEETRELRQRIWIRSRGRLAPQGRSRTVTRAGRSIAELARAAAEGDAEAWSELVDGVAGKLLKFARRCVPPADAEDLVQETMVVALEKAEIFGRHAEPQGYLFTILRNLIYNFERKRIRRETAVGPAADAAAVEEAVLARLLEEKRRDLVVNALAEVCTPLEQAVIVLSSRGLAPKEIGAELGITAGNASVVKHRAIGKLRRHLEGSG